MRSNTRLENRSMITTHDDFRHCPHCGKRTRHSIVSERVLAPVLWCLACFHTRLGDDSGEPAASPSVTGGGAGQSFRLAG